MPLVCVSWSSVAVGLYFCAKCSMTLIFAFVRPSTLSCNNISLEEVINCGQFDVCTSSSFRGANSDNCAFSYRYVYLCEFLLLIDNKVF